MLNFDFLLGLTLLKQMILDKIRQQEEKKRERIRRKAVFNERGVICIEETIKMPRFRYKTLVLLSAQGIARRHITTSLVGRHPEKYGYPTMHTSRPPRPHEVNGSRFTFVTRRQMMLDIRNDKFMEHGVHNDHFYGVKLDSVRTIHRDGKMAIVEIDPMTLRLLRNPEFAPFIVFIAPPVLHNVTDYDGTLTRLNNESDQIRRDYAHLIDMTVVLNDMDETITTLEVVMDDVMNSPQWVPSNWIPRRRRC